VGILGVGIMNLIEFSLSSNNNSKIDGNQITSGAIDFQPHQPTLANSGLCKLGSGDGSDE
jgi:hypothetical protein